MVYCFTLEIFYKMSDSVTKFFENGGYVTNHTNETRKDKIVEQVKKLMDDRSEQGQKEYGTTLQDNPDGFYSWLNELQTELLDAALYIQKIKKIR